MKRLLLSLALLPSLALADPECRLSTAGADIAFQPVKANEINQADYGVLVVNCPSGMAWTVEITNAQTGGVLPLDDGRGNTIPSYLTISATGQTLGSQVNGEALTGEGIGSDQAISVRSRVSLPGVPPAGTYQGTAQVLLNF